MLRKYALLFLVVLAALALMVTFVAQAHASAPGLPALGWNSWYSLGAGVNEAAVLQQAQLMHDDGLVTAGYDTVALDDGWQAKNRTAAGALTWNPVTFPDGIPGLLGKLKAIDPALRLGIYTAIGSQTCVHNPGSWAHYQQDVNTFQSWGVSFVKVDDCGSLPAGTTYDQETTYFRDFSNRVSRTGMGFSEELPVIPPVGSANWLKGITASAGFSPYVQWRVAPDEHWTESANFTITSHLEADVHLHGYARSGHWNDLDMITGANKAGSAHPFNWSLAQQQSQLSVWAAEASPLFVSENLAAMAPAEVAALVNPDIIAIDQSGSQATGPLSGHIQALAKPADGGTAVLLANTGSGTGSAKFTLAQLGINAAHVTGKNIWTGCPVSFSGISVTLAAGQTELLILR